MYLKSQLNQIIKRKVKRTLLLGIVRLSILLLISTFSMVYAADIDSARLPKDKYNPTGPEVSEKNFKETLKKEGLVWVMYEYTGRGMENIYIERGEAYWNALKREFGNQVNAYIRINIDAWHFPNSKALQEIGRNAYPSFTLYLNGNCVVSDDNNDIRIRGVPETEQRIRESFEYIRKNSRLK